MAGKEERWLTTEEALRLYRAVRHWRFRYLNLFVRIGLATGARHEAILSLTWDRVDLETGYIDFRVPGRVITKKRRPHAPTDDRTLRLLRAAARVSNGEHVIALAVRGHAGVLTNACTVEGHHRNANLIPATKVRGAPA